jgi:hypothetical protein
MSVVQDLIDDAATTVGVKDLYNQQDATVNTYAFTVLNRMLDAWTGEQTPLFDIVDSQVGAPIPGFTLVGAQALYSLGPAALLGVRPASIVDIYLLDNNNVSYYQEIINADQFARLIYKIAPGRPTQCYVNYNAATVDLTFYPTPSYVDTVHVLYSQALAAFTNTAQVIVYPPGWEEAFVLNLGVRLARRFGKPVTPDMMQAAMWAKNAISAGGETKYILQTPIPTMKRRFFNILTGESV